MENGLARFPVPGSYRLPLVADPQSNDLDADLKYITTLCDQYNIPFATNVATAEILIHGLERGDLDWRDIINPKTKPFTA